MKVQKAYAISDAKIQFVSLVDKAANKQRFLITKAEDGKANFTTYGQIIKADKDHYVTGIVYEPMTEDAHGNYMTEEEIVKAQRWFAKNGNQVDIQHSFEPFDNASVVESWVTKAECTIGDKEIKKGTWLMTVEVADDDVWNAIEKGEITGFSMGGMGKYSDVDEDISKSVSESESKSIFKRLAEFFGFNVVEKGEVSDRFKQKQISQGFWNAWYSLQETLSRYNEFARSDEFEKDEAVIRTALQEFSDIVTQVLTSETGLAKSLAQPAEGIEKAGRKISSSNRQRLQTVYENLGAFLSDTEDKPKEEDDEMTSEEIKNAVDEAIEPIKKALKIDEKDDKTGTQTEDKSATTDGKTATDGEGTDKDNAEKDKEKEKDKDKVTKAMVEEIVKKAVKNDINELTDSVADAINKALEPIYEATGATKNLNHEPNVLKTEQHHYMEGIF